MKHPILPAVQRLAVLLAAGILSGCANRPPASLPPPDRPSFLIIITDDQRYDTMAYMPETRARIFEQGATFNRGYVTTPLCCPSRSSVLTGLYAHHHNVLVNRHPLAPETLVAGLHASGYLTGVVGKYLNSYPVSDDDGPLPEFDYWVAHGSLDGGGDYFNTRLNVQGEWQTFTRYLTHVERDFALEFLDQAAQSGQPFFLLLGLHAPHTPTQPAPGDEALYADLEPFRPPNFNEGNLTDKPRWIQQEGRLPPYQVEENDIWRLDQLRTLKSADEAVAALMDRLESLGRLDNTVVIFMSDNGVLWNEHGQRGKILLYEPSIRVPIGLRYPPLVPEPIQEDRFVLNIDLAPTIYELAGVQPPYPLDGRSLIPLLRGEADDWREDFVIESWHQGRGLSLRGLHTERYVYIETWYSQTDHDTELYDLQADPYQLESQHAGPASAALLEALRARLEALAPLADFPILEKGGGRPGIDE